MDRKNPAQRRYVRRFLPAMSSYVLFLFASTWAIRDYAPTGLPLFLLALLPALPLLAALAIMGLYLIEEQDEFIRNRLLQAMIGGTGVLLAVLTVWGFLEERNVVPHFPTYLAFPLWCGAFGMVQCLRSWSDRSAPQS